MPFRVTPAGSPVILFDRAGLGRARPEAVEVALRVRREQDALGGGANRGSLAVTAGTCRDRHDEREPDRRDGEMQVTHEGFLGTSRSEVPTRTAAVLVTTP